MVERTLRVHPLWAVPAILKELSDAPAELEKSLEKVTTTVDPEGNGLTLEKLMV